MSFRENSGYENTNSIVRNLLRALLFCGFAKRAGGKSAARWRLSGFNTAEGTNALKNLTTGQGNTAVGWFSLSSSTDGSYSTGVGAGTLALTIGDQNTATGVAALLLNTTGSFNTANGALVLSNNTEGDFNTATGDAALFSNDTGTSNTANGAFALFSNTTGLANMASGNNALSNNTSGGGNIALGADAGVSVTTANNVICIGASGQNVSNSCYIGQIFGATSASGTAVFINSDGKLGTTTSSRRFKEEIKPMEQASEALLALKPVSFHYTKEIDPAGTQQLGLVAEEVEKVNPDLVVRDKSGKPYSVRYDQVNAMLLNEFLKEHRNNEQQGATIAQLKQEFAEQRTQIEALTAGLQKVSAQLEASKSAPQVVNNP